MNKLQISLLVITSSTVIPKMQISLPEVVEVSDTKCSLGRLFF